jgi:hypothetical protein
VVSHNDTGIHNVNRLLQTRGTNHVTGNNTNVSNTGTVDAPAPF